MAKHDVTFNLPERALGKADATFKVKVDGEVLGSLKISNGSLVWVPGNKQYGYKMTWEKFDSLTQEHGTHGH